ncbi:NADH-quinone oxidoreductase subunit E 1 [Nymphon striatum]|nr:NADH-quinone oxidoreductase subunit E 1 [Nymphon striatum]
MGAEAKGWIKKYPKGREQSAVIPLLMLAQEQEGWVTKASIEHIADMLGMPLIRVMEGTCVNAPMVMIFKDTYEDLTPERLEEIIDTFEAGKGDTVPVGPQIERIFSAPAGGLTTLNGKPVGKAKRAPAKKAAAKTAPASKKAAPKKAPAKKSCRIERDDWIPQAKRLAKNTGTTQKTAPKKAAAPTKKASVKTAGPVRLKKPEGKADDLKLISGVGPKLEKTLNGLGFWHFRQIAAWKKADIAIVDDELSFKGRIERDDWIKQAKLLTLIGSVASTLGVVTFFFFESLAPYRWWLIIGGIGLNLIVIFAEQALARKWAEIEDEDDDL